MFTRAFNVVGLIARIAEYKAYLLGFAAKRSAIALLGYLIAALVAVGGAAILVGAGYVALERIFGVPIAMAIVGVFLLIVASLIVMIANQRGKSKTTGHTMTEDEVQRKAERDEEELRSMLGMNNDEPKTTYKRPAPRFQSPSQFNSINGLDNPKVLMAAGFALLGLLGPGRLFKTVKIATALASITALANRAIEDHQDKQSTH